jgi:hypothetical protein
MTTTEPTTEPTPERPHYAAVLQDDGYATPRYMVTCDEGWRSSIVCEGMYGWAAEWLVDMLQGRPYAAIKHLGVTR